MADHPRPDELVAQHHALTQQLDDLTAKLATYQRLLQGHEDRLEAFGNALPDLVIVFDEQGRYQEVLTGNKGLLFVDPDESLGRTLHEVLPRPTADAILKAIKTTLHTGESQALVYDLEVAAGRVWFEGRTALLRDEAGKHTRVVWATRDVTEQKRLEAEMFQIRHQQEQILNAAGEGIYGLDARGRTTFVNPAGARMLGYAAEELIGKPQHELIHYARPDGTPYPKAECPIYAAFHDGKTHQVDDEVFWRKDGTSFPVQYTSAPMRDERGALVGAVVVFEDITKQKRAEDELYRLANHDALTGLVNRRRFAEALEQALADGRRYGLGGALLMVDLDGFKAINDTHGHKVGDDVLRAVAEVLRQGLRESDTAARLGGDEFAVLMPHTDVAGALEVAHRLVAGIGALPDALPRVEAVAASVGVARYPEHSDDPDKLMVCADQALYQAKRSDAGHVVAYAG